MTETAPAYAVEMPTRYYVTYWDNCKEPAELKRVGGVSDAIDPSRVESQREAKTLPAAKAMARSIQRQGIGILARVWERVDIRWDAPDDAWGDDWWRWDDEMVDWEAEE